MAPKAALALAREALDAWTADGGPRLGAALAYYAFFSLTPLIIIVTAVAGMVFGEQAARGEVFRHLQGSIGPEAAAALERVVLRADRPAVGGLAALAGLAAMLLGASAAVTELQSALNHIWKTRAVGGLSTFARKRLISVAIILGAGFILIATLALNSAVVAAGEYFGGLVGAPSIALRLANESAAFVSVALLFAILFKWLPDADVEWGEVAVGAGVTAAAFTVGKYLLAWYLGLRTVGPYGAAGSLVLVLLWVYYSAQLLYLGAEFTRTYAAQRRGAAMLLVGGPAREPTRVFPAWLRERRRADRRVADRRQGHPI